MDARVALVETTDAGPWEKLILKLALVHRSMTESKEVSRAVLNLMLEANLVC